MLSYLHSIAGLALGPLSRTPAVPRGFRVIRKIGQGGMGVVYEALDESLQRRVAVKKLRDEHPAPADRERLREEARVVAMLKHPNIVQIHSLVEERGALFLVFELVDGITLDKFMERRGLPAETAVGLLRQLASALDYAHGLGVVHQDLKPSNIMVCGETVKIMDFGIARKVEELALCAARPLGTAAYMAPEQEIGHALKASDLYSLGVCLYEMLGGRGPFKNVASYFQKIERNYRPLTELTPSLPEAVDAVLATALDPFPERRYATAGALIDDLERVLGRPA